jgi:hypothetical protein
VHLLGVTRRRLFADCDVLCAQRSVVLRQPAMHLVSDVTIVQYKLQDGSWMQRKRVQRMCNPVRLCCARHRSVQRLLLRYTVVIHGTISQRVELKVPHVQVLSRLCLIGGWYVTLHNTHTA